MNQPHKFQAGKTPAKVSAATKAAAAKLTAARKARGTVAGKATDKPFDKGTLVVVKGSERRTILVGDLEPWLKDGWVKEQDVKAKPKAK